MREDYNGYLTNLFNKVHNKLQIGDMKAEEFFSVQIDTIEAVHEIVFNLGIDENIIKLTDQYVSATLDAAKSYEALYSLLEAIFMENNYIYVQANLTSYLICAIAAECNWISETNQRQLVIPDNLTLP